MGPWQFILQNYVTKFPMTADELLSLNKCSIEGFQNIVYNHQREHVYEVVLEGTAYGKLGLRGSRARSHFHNECLVPYKQDQSRRQALPIAQKCLVSSSGRCELTLQSLRYANTFIY